MQLRSQFQHSCDSERFIYICSHDRSAYFCSIAFADWSWQYINFSQIHECRSWERGRAVSFLGLFVVNFRYSAFAVQSLTLLYLRKTCNGAEIGTITGFILPVRKTAPFMTATSSALPVLHLANPEIWLPEVEPEYRKLSLNTGSWAWIPEVEPKYRKLSLNTGSWAWIPEVEPVPGALSLYLSLHPASRSPPYLPKLLPISTLLKWPAILMQKLCTVA